jgi:hypothetical protein
VGAAKIHQLLLPLLQLRIWACRFSAVLLLLLHLRQFEACLLGVDHGAAVEKSKLSTAEAASRIPLPQVNPPKKRPKFEALASLDLPSSAAAASALGVCQLKALLAVLGVDCAAAVEKSDLVGALVAHLGLN